MTFFDPRNATFLFLLLTSCASPTPAPSPWFEETAASAGIHFKHVRATTSNFYFPEIMSGGIGWLDYDNNGLMDLYVVQGGEITRGGDPAFTNKLYRNINGEHFEEVGAAAGVDDTGYGMGVTAGDIDNDGDTDLYVTNVGPNVLYRNNGDGTFTDISSTAGVDHPGWGSSAAFADVDGDGRLDLYLVNYIHWAPNQEMECNSGGAGRDYCHPDNYRAPATDALFLNEGNGTFRDVSATAGINKIAANGLGVVPGDFNNDHLVDFYVANDGDANQLWLNNGDGSFTDHALISGVAVNRQGTAEAGMGVIAFDLENDGDQDLLLAHLRDETNTLYRQQGGAFQDITIAAGLSTPSLPYTSFGLGAADFNHDGYLDLYVANGRVGRAGAADADDPFAEPNQLFEGLDAGKFKVVTPDAGLALPLIANSRGLALADYDNDGDMDVAIINNNGAISLLKNVAEKKGTWIGFVFTDQSSATDAHLLVITSDNNKDKTYHRRVQPAGSYQSVNDPRIHVGIPAGATIKSIEISWPDGSVQVLDGFDTGKYLEVDIVPGL